MKKRSKPNNVDLEKSDLRGVKTPIVFMPNFYRSGRILGPDAFYHALDGYEFCDALTYTVTDKFPLRTRRLIYCISESKKPLAQEAKQVVGNHAKLVICYSGKTVTAYLGSANHTGRGNFNFMYQLSPEETVTMVDFFETIWRTH